MSQQIKNSVVLTSQNTVYQTSPGSSGYGLIASMQLYRFLFYQDKKIKLGLKKWYNINVTNKLQDPVLKDEETY